MLEWSVAQIHTEFLLQEKVAFGFTVALLFIPGDIRLVHARARASSDREPVPLLTFLVADRTGPILCEAWRELGDHLFSYPLG